MGLRDRLDRIENSTTSAAEAVQAVADELKDGFSVKIRFHFTGPILKFLMALLKAAITGKEPDWKRDFPDGLPIEADAQIFLEE